MRFLFLYCFLITFVFTISSQKQIKKIFYEDSKISLENVNFEFSHLVHSRNNFRFTLGVLSQNSELIYIKKYGIVIDSNETVKLNKNLAYFKYGKSKFRLYFRGEKQYSSIKKIKIERMFVLQEKSTPVFEENLDFNTLKNTRLIFKDLELSFKKLIIEEKEILCTFILKNNGQNLICYDGTKNLLFDEQNQNLRQIKIEPVRLYIFPGKSERITLKFFPKTKDLKSKYELNLKNSIYIKELKNVNVNSELTVFMDYKKTAESNRITIEELEQFFPPKLIKTITINDSLKTEIVNPKLNVKKNDSKIDSCFNGIYYTEKEYEKIPEKYFLDSIKIKSDIVNILKENNKKFKNYQIQTASEYIFLLKNQLIKNQQIYYEWGELNDYALKILDNISEFRNPSCLKNHIKFLFVKNTSFNVSSWSDGTILINIGFLANIDSEAEFVNSILHEINHIYNGDLIEQLKYDKQIFANHYMNFYSHDFNPFNINSYHLFSEEVEKNNLYKTNEDFQLSKFSEDWPYKKYEKEKTDKKLTIVSQLNIQKSKYFIDSDSKPVFKKSTLIKPLFSIDECAFFTLKQQAVYECIKLFNKNIYPYEGLLYTIQEYNKNNRKEYLYPLLELIRKSTYLYPKLRNTKSHFLYTDSIKNTLISVTYDELFDIILKKVDLSNCIECQLSIALKNYVDKKDFLTYLNSYINNKNANYIFFANSLINPSVFLGKNELLIWQKFNINYKNVSFDLENELKPIYNANQSLFNKFKENKHLKNKKLTCVNNLNISSFELKDQITFYKVFKSFNNPDFQRKNFNLFYFYPELYEFMYKKDLKSIHFLTVDYNIIHSHTKIDNFNNDEVINSQFKLNSYRLENKKSQLKTSQKKNLIVFNNKYFYKFTHKLVQKNN
jgi:hypothetical protein